nr:chymotrypsin-C-like [Aedes albopictus]
MLPKLFPFILIVLLSMKSSYQQNCGVKKMVNYLIMDGTDTKKGEWPWHAAIILREENHNRLICGGTLISRKFVLTAAHCVINPETGYELSPRQLFILLGVYSLDDRSTQQRQEISKIIMHSDFDKDEVKSDIALLELQGSAQLNNYVQPACLGKLKSLIGKSGTAVGLGLKRDKSLARILQSAVMPVVSIVNCIESHRGYGQTVDRSSLCVGYETGTTVCNGDSGGGLFFDNGGAWYLGGIVSYGMQSDDDPTRCRENGYAIFIDVQLYLDWISKKANIRLSATQPIKGSTGSDCGPGCREFRCHVDPRLCVSNVAHATAVHHPHPDCTKFYTCKERTNIICQFDCPAGLHFNRNKKVCDWPWSAGCDVSGGRK